MASAYRILVDSCSKSSVRGSSQSSLCLHIFWKSTLKLTVMGDIIQWIVESHGKLSFCRMLYSWGFGDLTDSWSLAGFHTTPRTRSFWSASRTVVVIDGYSTELIFIINSSELVRNLRRLKPASARCVLNLTKTHKLVERQMILLWHHRRR